MPQMEYLFHPERKWRIDYCWPDHRLAVEIEGGAWTQGRHTRGKGFTADIEKYNNIQIAGYTLLRFTPQQVQDGTAIAAIQAWFKKKGDTASWEKQETE